MSRTPSGPHPKTAQVFRLSDQGCSQRQIATETGLSQSTVQRVLSGHRLGAPADPDGVYAEFDELYAKARVTNTLEAYKHVHETAILCHKNGYDVPFRSLPYLMCLSAALGEVADKRKRGALNAEIDRVWADIRAWRDS